MIRPWVGKQGVEDGRKTRPNVKVSTNMHECVCSFAHTCSTHTHTQMFIM
jgi:hypothetical protein